MHIVIDIRTLQIPSPDNEAFNHAIKNWLSAFLKMPYEHKVTLLIDPRFSKPVLDVPLSGSYWNTILFESHPQISGILNPEAEQLATHKTNDFLLEQKADLFHLTNPFVSAITVGYPPCVCRGVATVYDVAQRHESQFAKDGRLAATYYVKGQVLRYCSRIVANSQSAANELMKCSNLSAYRIDLIDDVWSPQKSALAIRQTYNKTLTSPFIMTSQGLVFPPDIPENDFGLNKLPALAAQADVADREYTVQSQIPVIGPLIAGIRRKMTSHLRERYFDPIIERQVSFNKKLVAALHSVCEEVNRFEQIVDKNPTQKYPQHVHASQDIIDEATEKVKEHDVLNPYLLAGPLPEYGDCLGHHFYEQLYKATVISMPNVSDAQKQINQSIIVALNKLAQQAEAYYEQRQSQSHSQGQTLKRLTFIPIFDMIFSNELNLPLQNNQMTSDQPYIGWLINWLQGQLTSHLQEPYIESILAKQVSFNRLAVMACSSVDLIHSISLKQLEAAAKITWHSSVRYSTKPIVGPIRTWFQKNSMSHLQEPYLDAIFKRQEAFNCAYVEILSAINKKITAIRLKKHYERLIRKFEIKRGLKGLKERNFAAIDEHGGFVKASAEQTEFIYQFLYLIEQMNSKVEVGL